MLARQSAQQIAYYLSLNLLADKIRYVWRKNAQHNETLRAIYYTEVPQMRTGPLRGIHSCA